VKEDAGDDQIAVEPRIKLHDRVGDFDGIQRVLEQPADERVCMLCAAGALQRFFISISSSRYACTIGPGAVLNAAEDLVQLCAHRGDVFVRVRQQIAQLVVPLWRPKSAR